jgi:hypothetical protein
MGTAEMCGMDQSSVRMAVFARRAAIAGMVMKRMCPLI